MSEIDAVRLVFSPVDTGDGRATGSFHAELLVAPATHRGVTVAAFDGGFVADDDHVVTAIHLSGTDGLGSPAPGRIALAPDPATIRLAGTVARQ